MATTIPDELYKTFIQVQGQQASALTEVNLTLSGVLAQVQDLRAPTPPANVKTASSSGSASQGSSAGDTLSTVASAIFKSGFGLAPMITGLISLFGGDSSPAPAPLVKYALPASVALQGAESGGGLTGVDYDQSGMARAYQASSTVSSPSPAGTPGGAAAPLITVNVQAMDARSFLDRSGDIALAVRDAMLNMNAINDVVGEL
jgi:hypothetical protein